MGSAAESLQRTKRRHLRRNGVILFDRASGRSVTHRAVQHHFANASTDHPRSACALLVEVSSGAAGRIAAVFIHLAAKGCAEQPGLASSAAVRESDRTGRVFIERL